MPALPRCEIWLSAVASGMRKPIRNTGALGREQEVACVQVVVQTNTGWTEPRICRVNYPDLADQVLHKKQSFPDTPRVCAAPQLWERSYHTQEPEAQIPLLPEGNRNLCFLLNSRLTARLWTALHLQRCLILALVEPVLFCNSVGQRTWE